MPTLSTRTPTRFTTAHRDHVTVQVNSADEGRHAIKELRHLKREVKAELRDLKAAHRTAAAREKRARRAKPQPLFESFGDFVVQAFASVATIGRTRARRAAPRSAADLKRDIDARTQLISSIDAVKLQIEGKLVATTGPGA
ncbi:MAG: hypothetical protein AAGG99_03535 [Pseudomonadota bacterium]